MKNLRTFLIALVGAAVMCGAPTILLPQAGIPVAFPHIQLPAEAIHTPIQLFGEGYFGQLFLSNTFLMVLIADVIVLLMGIAAGSAARRRLAQYQQNPKAVDAEGQDLMVPRGWLNTFEAIMEYLHDLIGGIVSSKYVQPVFNVSVTIFLLVLVANYLHFVPLVDSFGTLHCTEHGGFYVEEIGSTGIYQYDIPAGTVFPTGVESEAPCPAHGEGEEEHGAVPDTARAKTTAHEGEEHELTYVIAPFLRTAATDLNLTFALAIVSIVFVQVMGVRELGAGYFTKFFNLPALSNGFVGWIELVVSWIEILSEIFKMVSLAFRLFGNIFAGAILLLVIAYLVPVGAPLVFWLLEVLIGAIQAFVFAMLTIVFVAVAQAGHGDHEEHEEEHH